MTQTPEHDLAVVDFNVTELARYYRNPRRGDVDAIAASLAANGQYRPIIVNTGRQTGRPLEVLAGNHTLDAAKQLDWSTVKAVTVDVDDVSAARIVAADNRTSDLGTYDSEALLALLTEDLPDLDGTGYDDDALAELMRNADADPLNLDDDEDDDRAPSTGERLALADVTFDDPATEVHRGQVWRVGRHTLVIARLRDEHHLWADRLTDGTVFAPYPEPYLTTTTEARETPFLLVQPNLFLAGHLLDKHRAAFPDETVELDAGATA
ncbi:ParB-like nuclease family protein [Haloactinopolyspora alba]|uniref:ParB-like nuclease family protein n=1 Tax=Haloactinopolyspora alba TaxID=648780 RepID=A0A2P8DF01_9ACTN|nr:ParB N-terminal domain-containing protein [Haloactinopolyspora alba]PSK95791.1 ParB-like nuclease family protein [Haloactinopolyspora alba]